MRTRLKHIIYEKKVDTNFWCTKQIAIALVVAMAAAAPLLPTVATKTPVATAMAGG